MKRKVAKMIPYRKEKAEEPKRIRLKQSGRTRLQKLEYYDFIGFSNPLSGILPTVVDGPPFLPWHGKINSFERLNGTHDPNLV